MAGNLPRQCSRRPHWGCWEAGAAHSQSPGLCHPPPRHAGALQSCTLTRALLLHPSVYPLRVHTVQVLLLKHCAMYSARARTSWLVGCLYTLIRCSVAHQVSRLDVDLDWDAVHSLRDPRRATAQLASLIQACSEHLEAVSLCVGNDDNDCADVEQLMVRADHFLARLESFPAYSRQSSLWWPSVHWRTATA